MIQGFASQWHYADHIRPILDLLGAPLLMDPKQLDPRATVMVASWVDSRHRLLQMRRKIVIEHGAGQSYFGDSNAVPRQQYAGGWGHQNVVGFICPSARVAEAWKTIYPETPKAVVGCPKMDDLHRRRLAGELHRQPNVIAWTWHWDHEGQIPECRSAFPEYAKHIAALIDGWREDGFVVVGHGHPRDEEILRSMWRSIGVEWWGAQEILESASILICDNTSLGTEFASLDRPVLWLNSAEHYRRDVNHGGRFWDWQAMCPEIWPPWDLADLDLDDLYQPRFVDARRALIPSIYAHTDGTSAQRAADFIRSLV